MRTRSSWLAAALAALGIATTAAAAPCFIIVDRNDAVVYRDVQPPFDLSDPNAPERSALRKRGQHMIVAEFENCYAVGYISPTTGATTASVDDIVMRLKSATSTSMSKTPGSYRTP